jgi:hypothetical protein
MRLDNGAAVLRFKFTTQEALDQACADLLEGSGMEPIARYYLKLNGLDQVQYHYGLIEHLKTLYFMF